MQQNRVKRSKKKTSEKNTGKEFEQIHVPFRNLSVSSVKEQISRLRPKWTLRIKISFYPLSVTFAAAAALLASPHFPGARFSVLPPLALALSPQTVTFPFSRSVLAIRLARHLGELACSDPVNKTTPNKMNAEKQNQKQNQNEMWKRRIRGSGKYATTCAAIPARNILNIYGICCISIPSLLKWSFRPSKIHSQESAVSRLLFFFFLVFGRVFFSAEITGKR